MVVLNRDAQWLWEDKQYGNEVAKYEIDKERLAKGEPLAYVIGWQPFLGLKIYLDSRPLIPRVETEWWTEQMLKDAEERLFEGVSQRDGARHSKFSAENYACPKTDAPPHLISLDLCSGSGAIGCAALARLPGAHVYFGEIDPAHETTILKNIRENNLDEPASPKTSSRGGSRAHVCIGDLFTPFKGIQFDVIAANPPYVPAGRALPTSVARYEPSLALFAGTDGLDYIRKIAAELPKYLAKGGIAWIECDRGHAEASRALFAEQGFAAEIRTDQYDKPRVICIHN